MQADVDRIERLVEARFPGAAPRIQPIPAGLGHRRFYRVALSPSTTANDPDRPVSLVARVDPPAPAPAASRARYAWSPEPELESIRAFLESAGLPVPLAYHRDPAARIDLLEDVGTRTLLDVEGGDQRRWYRAASALLPRLQSLTASAAEVPAFGRRFDAALVRTKAAKVLDWSFPGWLGRSARPDEREALETGFDALGALLVASPARLAHRDFKAENIHLVRSPNGEERLVWIDLQGAFLAPPEYDLVCLLRDVQASLPEALVAELQEEALARLPDAAARAQSRERFEAIAVLRLAKDIAHIVDAATSRGDRRRWHEIPHGLALLEGSLRRLEHTFPRSRALHNVIHALTRGARSSDSGTSRQGT